ncbi:hypothetical protein C9J47_19505 [Photobacterium indicum]|uniref:Uncharacterized protein n=1 Tax=Photobacterium indicum TaxID=81447 RepID=A0A2T3L592_9GAMM|nr:hypothetical protein C9J47_19505 [Photobacterium indicum]
MFIWSDLTCLLLCQICLKGNAFLAKNTPKKVTTSLRHLADESKPITQRITDFPKEPFNLYGLGESAIKEFNCWYYPNKYPIWNKKSDRALNILRFG